MTQSEKDVLPVIFSNLKQAAEKQQEPVLAESFSNLASEFDTKKYKTKTLSELKEKVAADLSGIYPWLQADAADAEDRGVMRALKWGQKVTAIQKALIDRYESKGEPLLEGESLFVCEACGFIFLGDSVPEICPVCKAPASRFSKV